MDDSINPETSGYLQHFDTLPLPAYPVQPCPSCGHCPTCGRGPSYPVYGPTWYYSPWHTPFWSIPTVITSGTIGNGLVTISTTKLGDGPGDAGTPVIC